MLTHTISILKPFTIIIFIVFLSFIDCNAINQQHLLDFFRSESASLSASQKLIEDFLISKKIPVNDEPGSLRKLSRSNSGLKIAVSTDSVPLECRISLGKVSVGRKCISPCACTGSQQWIAFSEFNRLRRKEPSQWRVCRTCMQKYDLESLVSYSGIYGNLVGIVLDNSWLLRSLIGAVLLATAYAISLQDLIMRFLVSRTLWQQYPQWSRIVHLPLVLKFWGGKLVLQYIGLQYLKLEQAIIQYLAEVETKLVEPALPIIA